MFRNTRVEQGPVCFDDKGQLKSPDAQNRRKAFKHGILDSPRLDPDRNVRSQSAVLISLVAKEGGLGGSRILERCDGKHGSEDALCATCKADPLIVTRLAALAPSPWDLDIAANSAPGATLVMVANVSRQSTSVEALWKLYQTRRNAILRGGGQAIRLENALNCLSGATSNSMALKPSKPSAQAERGVPISPLYFRMLILLQTRVSTFNRLSGAVLPAPRPTMTGLETLAPFCSSLDIACLKVSSPGILILTRPSIAIVTAIQSR